MPHRGVGNGTLPGRGVEGAPRNTPQHTGLSYAPALIPAQDGGCGYRGWELCTGTRWQQDGDGDTTRQGAGGFPRGRWSHGSYCRSVAMSMKPWSMKGVRVRGGIWGTWGTVGKGDSGGTHLLQ